MSTLLIDDQNAAVGGVGKQFSDATYDSMMERLEQMSEHLADSSEATMKVSHQKFLARVEKEFKGEALKDWVLVEKKKG